MKRTLCICVLLIVLGGVVLALSACGGVAGPATTPTLASSTSTSLAPTQSSATVPSSVTTQASTATTAPASARADKLGDEVEQLLQQLNDANAKADTLDDVPELK
jgi:hypothetical protein